MEASEILELEAPILSQAQEKRCYSVKEVMDILGVSRRVVYDLIRENRFRTVRISNMYRISKKSFDQWLDEQM